jgi:hypothetical protein
MKKTFALLVASTALGAALGLPAVSGIPDAAGGAPQPVIAVPGDVAQTAPLILASDDGDDDHGWRAVWGGGNDDDDEDEDEDDDDDCDDGDGNCPGAARNPAPAGTVAPPQNGLFGNGAPPRVQMN